MKKLLYAELVGEMAKHGETQKTVAKFLELTPQSIGKKLAGKNDWTISEIEKLCEHYDKNYYELFKKNEEQK